jgi:predicted NBD/HSP70 family sugar kinase
MLINVFCCKQTPAARNPSVSPQQTVIRMSRIEPVLLSKINQRRVLEIIQQDGPCTRAAIVRRTDISAPTVSKVVAALMNQGLLEEESVAEESFGRPAKRLRLAKESAQVIGIALEPRRCWIVSAGLDGNLCEEEAEQFATPGTYHGLIDAMAERGAKLMKRPGVNTLGVGISLAGLVNQRLQESVLSPNMHVTDGRSPARDLAKRIGVECIMQNDTNMLCLAERFYGAAKGLDDFAVLDVTTGLGLGVVAGGRLLAGNSGMATEIGHITVNPNGRLCGCGNHGCLETLATEGALVRAISQRYNMALEIDDVIQLVRSGEIQPDEEIRQTLEYVAIAVATVINLFNPSTVFVIGKLFDAQENMFQQLLHLVRQRTLAPILADCRILRAQASHLHGAVAGIVSHVTSALGPKVALPS